MIIPDSTVSPPSGGYRLHKYFTVNIYRRFMLNEAGVMEPLFKATSGNPKPNGALEWTQKLSNAFTRTTNLLIHATALNYAVSDAPI